MLKRIQEILAAARGRVQELEIELAKAKYERDAYWEGWCETWDEREAMAKELENFARDLGLDVAHNDGRDEAAE